MANSQQPVKGRQRRHRTQNSLFFCFACFVFLFELKIRAIKTCAQGVSYANRKPELSCPASQCPAVTLPNASSSQLLVKHSSRKRSEFALSLTTVCSHFIIKAALLLLGQQLAELRVDYDLSRQTEGGISTIKMRAKVIKSNKPSKFGHTKRASRVFIDDCTLSVYS